MTDLSVATASEHEDHDEHHPSDAHYIRIAIGLAVLTAIEVAMAYVGLEGLWLVLPLLIVMVVKFVIVASHFMHLKYDSKVLSRVFYAGLLLAAAVYLVTLVTFHTFEKDACYDHVSAEECAK